MAERGSVSSTSPALSSDNQGSERMNGVSTPQTESDSKTDCNHSYPLRGRKSSQDPPNDPIQIPKIMTDISFTEDPAILARGLEGKHVDEFGNILGWDGTVLGRVEGDLPSMVGRCVSDDGRVRDAAGDLAGHVSDNYLDSSTPPENTSNKRLKIDPGGTIYDHNGAVVGKMKHHTPESNNDAREEGCAKCRERERSTNRNNGPDASRSEERTTGAATANVPHRTAAPSPSDIYLDVKSTHDGIQLIIKIPTVFNRNQEDRK